MAACREYGVRDILDDSGHRYLRRLPAAGLARAAHHIEKTLRSGYHMPSPLGVIVKAAKTGDDVMSAIPPAPPAPGDPSAKLIAAARSHAATLTSVADIDDDERRYVLTEEYHNDQAALAAALGVLDSAGCSSAPVAT